jgi:hypothetical protein
MSCPRLPDSASQESYAGLSAPLQPQPIAPLQSHASGWTPGWQACGVHFWDMPAIGGSHQVTHFLISVATLRGEECQSKCTTQTDVYASYIEL